VATGSAWLQPLPSKFHPASSVRVSPGVPGVVLSKTLQPKRTTCVVVVVVATVLVLVVVAGAVDVVDVVVVVTGKDVVVVVNVVVLVDVVVVTGKDVLVVVATVLVVVGAVVGVTTTGVPVRTSRTERVWVFRYQSLLALRATPRTLDTDDCSLVGEVDQTLAVTPPGNRDALIVDRDCVKLTRPHSSASVGTRQSVFPAKLLNICEVSSHE